jgi:hypothetical protein
MNGALYPVLPLRDIVVFPHMIWRLFVSRELAAVRASSCIHLDFVHPYRLFLSTHLDLAQIPCGD